MREQSQRPDPLSLSPEQREVICVLGGRSGTSLVARLVNILGVYLGREKHMMAANRANERGFWEHTQIVALNDEILARYGSKWPKLVPLPHGWENDPKLDDLRDRALKLIRKEFADAPLWGWKDPRACATLPFWQALMPKMRYVLCFRNPIDTARSNADWLKSEVKQAPRGWLAQMQERLYLAGMVNWLEFVCYMFKHTSGRPQLALLYEDVMEQTDSELRRIARFIGKPEAAADPKVLAAVREFKSDKLRHHNTSLDEVLAEAALPLIAKRVFLSLRARVTLEREAQRAAEHGEAERKLEEAMPLDALNKLTDAAMKQRGMNLGDGIPKQPTPDAHSGMAGLAAMSAVLAELEEKEAARQALKDHVRRVIVQHTPADAQVVVVSHGDDELLKGTGRPAKHFPQDEHGDYLGYHPADSADAISALRDVQASGATFLAIPKRQLWWLDHYAELREHLASHHRKIYGDEQCVLYELQGVVKL